MQTKIDDLVQKKDEIRSSLEDLSKVVEAQEKEKRQKEIAKKLDELKKQIDAFSTTDDVEKWKLTTLKSDVDQLSTDLKKIETELQNLKEWVLADKKDATTTPSKTTTEAKAKNEKWFRWKSKDFVKEQWSDVWSGEKWKEEPWKNLLRTVWFVWTGAAVVAWAVSLWNWAFGSKKKKKDGDWDSSEKKEKKSFWDTTTWKVIKTTGTILWVGTGVYYLAHGLYTQNRWLIDIWDWERGKKLEFDAAMSYAEWAISNQNYKEGMSYGLNLKYHEDTSEIEAYWVRVKIDKNKRKIVWTWMDWVTFKKYEDMICTAILIAYLKKNYSWKCQNNAPFNYSWAWKWNINVNGWDKVDWTWNGWRIVGISTAWIAWIAAWIFGWLKAWAVVALIGWILGYAAGYAYDTNNILHDYMPEIDTEFWMKSLCSYLNSLKCWKEWNQNNDEIVESPIKKEVKECVEELQSSHPELTSRWRRRKLNAIPDPNNEKLYTITAYWRNMKAEVDASNKTIKILGISWWNPEVKSNVAKWKINEMKLPLKEWIYMSALMWFFLDNFHHKWNEYPRFEYTWKAIRTAWTVLGKNNYWIYFSDSGPDTLACTKENFEKRMPTLFREENRNRFLEFLNDWITDEDGVSIWKGPDCK